VLARPDAGFEQGTPTMVTTELVMKDRINEMFSPYVSRIEETHEVYAIIPSAIKFGDFPANAQNDQFMGYCVNILNFEMKRLSSISSNLC
jgi:hypothetical protein